MKKIMQYVMMAVVACFFAVGAGSVGQVEAAALYTPLLIGIKYQLSSSIYSSGCK